MAKELFHKNSFEAVYKLVKQIPSRKVDSLKTTGGTEFWFEAIIKDGKDVLHANSGKNNQSHIYIFSDVWYDRVDSKGTWIGHYSAPIDDWYTNIRRLG